MLKRAVLAARSGSFRLKKRRFLKLPPIFIGIKIVYHSDYQHLSCNAKNKRFLSSKDNVPANIGCMHGQNSPFVKFIRIYQRGVIYRILPWQSRHNAYRIVFGRLSERQKSRIYGLRVPVVLCNAYPEMRCFYRVTTIF